MVVQVNGKLRDRLEVAVDISEQEAVKLALASPNVAHHLGGGEPKWVVAKPPNLVNLVV